MPPPIPWQSLWTGPGRQMCLAAALLTMGYASRLRHRPNSRAGMAEFAHTHQLRRHTTLCDVLHDFVSLGQDVAYEELVDMVDAFLTTANSSGDRHVAKKMFHEAKIVYAHGERLVKNAQRGADMDRVCACVHAEETTLPALQSALDAYVHNKMLG
jgi:hypothetical protein